MTITIVGAAAIFVGVSIHYLNNELKKSKKQKKMLKTIESILKEIRKLSYIFQKFGEMESFIIYLENTTRRLYHGSLSDKEFEKYKKAFRNEMQSKYKTLIYEIAFVSPSIRKTLNSNPEYFGKID